MKAIVIYHNPDHISPYLLFVSAETGLVAEHVNLPYVDEYYDGGREEVKVKERTGRTAEQNVDTTRLPKVGEVYENFVEFRKFRMHRRRGGVRYRGDRYWEVDSISDVTEDDRFIHTYRGLLHLVEYRERTEHKFVHRSKDSYIVAMTEAGFDMTGWCQYKRNHTYYNTFIREVVKTYRKDKYEIINFLRIE